MKKIEFFILMLLASTLLAKEGEVVIAHKGENAILYVDGKKNIHLTKELTSLLLEEGNHRLKVIEPISQQCERYKEKEVYVSSSGSVKVTFKLEDKREPTEKYKKILDKKDSKKRQRFHRSEAMTVSDLKRRLIWQDDAYPSRTKRDLKGAQQYCQSLKFSTFDDWRVPTYDELLSLVDYDRYNPAIVPVFKKTFSKRYWSSSQDISAPDYAWVIDFGHGKTSTTIKSRRHYVRCVREQ